MKRLPVLAAALVIVPVLSVSLLAAPAATQPAKPMAKPMAKATAKPRLPVPFSQMEAELNLTDAQRSAIIEKNNAKAAALREWEEKNKARLDVLKASAQEAKAKGERDPNARESTTLRKDRAALADKYEEEIVKVLTPEQRAIYAGFNSYSGAMRRYAALKLTEEQKNQIKAQYIKAGPQIASASTEKERDVIRESVRKSVEAQVLTDEQRTELATAAAEKSKATKEARVATPKAVQPKPAK
jgi:Spy/CpxP family protein refolding chaperone